MPNLPSPSTSPRPAPLPSPSHRAGVWVLRVAAVAATLAVFALYTRPEFMVMLADQMWSCF